MATNTYVALDKVTVGTATASVTFSSIPATYTDLVIVVNGNESATFDGVLMQVGNGTIDTGSNYSVTRLRGNGSTASSGRDTSATSMNIGLVDSASMSINIFQFMNYANTTTYKTILSRGNATGNMLQAAVGLWRSTTAITTIKITAGGGNWNVGSTFSLYGIASSAVGAKATGGIITSDSQYYYHTFLSSGTFTPTQSLTCDYLVAAGGGGGGSPSYSTSGDGGGGGAGGLRSTVTATGGGGSLETALSLSASGYTVTVGAGGAGGSGLVVRGSSGSNSVFSTITSTGGGGGGVGQQGSSSATGPGIAGGSGGGGGGGTNQAIWATAAGTTNQGYAGGVNTTAAQYGAGGGGGAGAVGQNGSTTQAGNGGAGVSSIINGSSVERSGGGAAGKGASTIAGTATGGGGSSGSAGTANTGGGGGGAGTASDLGGAGGSGIVIVRYAK